MLTQGQSIQINGHVATLQINNVPVVENECEVWSQRLKRALNTSDIDVMGNLKASVVVNDSEFGCLKQSLLRMKH